jgi:hypothetical protein
MKYEIKSIGIASHDGFMSATINLKRRKGSNMKYIHIKDRWFMCGSHEKDKPSKFEPYQFGLAHLSKNMGKLPVGAGWCLTGNEDEDGIISSIPHCKPVEVVGLDGLTRTQRMAGEFPNIPKLK